MLTIDETVMNAPMEACFRAAADVEEWPSVLPHYRWVRFQRREGFGAGLIEMAARRAFGPLSYPVWWVSEMKLDEDAPAVLYTHVDGITAGMDVIWSFADIGGGRTMVKIVHDWSTGPRWPLPLSLRKLIADVVIGPLFIHHVASRTLQGIKAKAESMNSQEGRGI